MTDADPPAADPLDPGPKGLEIDLPCPGCGYNLRGLTIPRCPECGYHFSWSDVPRIQAELLQKNRPGKSLIAIAVGLLIALVALPFLLMPLLIFLLAVMFAFVISAFQAAVEIAVAWPFLGTFSRRRFRSWWEGVLIGYGLCAVTCLAVGWPIIIFGYLMPKGSFPLSALLVITAVESFAVQWWVVRARARQWDDPLPAGRLALACLAAKAFIAIPWVLIVTHVLVR